MQEQASSSVDGPTSTESCAARQTSAEELVEMVRNACRRTMDNEVQNSFLRRDPRRTISTMPSPERTLTSREREVLKLLAEGKTVRAAATVLGLSSKTVDAHKFNLMRKLGLHNKAELVMWAIQKNFVKIPANF
jgi:DNA-binding NarL/FixJ family response regulator